MRLIYASTSSTLVSLPEAIAFVSVGIVADSRLTPRTVPRQPYGRDPGAALAVGALEHNSAAIAAATRALVRCRVVVVPTATTS
jgi:hypothetical protein